jgi:hypothetical protein
MAFATEPPWGAEWIGASERERGAALEDLIALADAVPQGLRVAGSPSLAGKILAVDEALSGAGIPHAVGGAIALAYYGEPRMTIDVDVNVFVLVDRSHEIAQALAPLGIDVEMNERELARDQEARLMWDRNPVHLFFSHDPLHEVMPAAVRRVPFADSTIPIVSPEHLVIRKATLDRPKDWLDIEPILVAKTPLDLEEVRTWLTRLAGRDDQRPAKLEEMVGAS